MAFNIHWKIPFKSLRTGTLYTVNIWKDGTLPSGYPLKLNGGAQPFTTQEDDSEDMFTPIRTQTGYIRIVDDGHAVNSASTPATVNFNWKELLPSTDTDRPVTLTHVSNGQTVVDWQGFMQAQNFSGTLYGGAQERELPVQCMLSALSASDVDGTNREMKNVAYVIKQAFDNLPGITISNYIFQGGEKAQSWLLKLVDWQNFIAGSDDGLSGKYDNQRVIQDLCQFWGWTCRTYGSTVLFCCADDNTNLSGVLTLTQAQLNTMAGGTSAGSTIGTFLSSLTLTGDIFASVNNDDTLVRGISKAMVTADGNQSEKEVIGFAPSGVEKAMKERTPTYSESDGDKYANYTADLLSFDANYVTGSCQENYASFNIRSIREHDNIYDFKDEMDVIRIKKSFSSVLATAYASLQTVFHHSFYDPTSLSVGTFRGGGLRMHGKIYRKATQLDDNTSMGNMSIGNKKMYMRIGIGKTRATAKWYTGNGWSNVESSFMVAIGGIDETLYVKSESSGPHGTGYSYSSFIPTNENGLIGKMFVEFLGSDDLSEVSGERSFDIAGFSIEFVRSTTSTEIPENKTTADKGAFGGARKYRVIERAGSREYVSKNVNKSRDEWNADCIYASDNDMEFGFGVLMEPTTGIQMGKQTYGSTQQWPEQHLADRVTSYWASAKRKLGVELRTDQISEVTPRNTANVDDTNSYPIGISRDWRDDVTKITFLEL